MVYKPLLVPYDGSRPADHAVQHAFNISKMDFMEKLTSEVNLLYVVQKIHVPPSLDYGMRPYSYSPGTNNDYSRICQRSLSGS
jgi:nucleotide-binding universal stress UspA family protein